jgi:hypothetical protein
MRKLAVFPGRGNPEMAIAIAAGSSFVGPGSAGPADHVAIGSFRHVAEQASKSRERGGIHLEDDNNQTSMAPPCDRPFQSGPAGPDAEGATMATDASDREQQRRELEEIRRKFAETGARMGSMFEPAPPDD